MKYFFRTYDLKNNHLKRRWGKGIELNKKEIQLIRVLKSRRMVTNSIIMDKVILENELTYDMRIKKKNKLIDNLNLKFLKAFNKTLIINAFNPSDKRQSVYWINKRIRIVDKNFDSKSFLFL